MAKRAISAITILSSLLVMFLAMAAFALSYSALRSLAGDNGIPSNLTWLWPLTIDGFILAAALSILRGSLLGDKVRWQWGLLAAVTTLSIGFNIAHAPSTLLARMIAAVPPAALFLALELLTGQLKSDIGRGGVIQSLAEAEQQLTQRRAELDKLTARIARAERQAELAEVSSLGNLAADDGPQGDALALANVARQAHADNVLDSLLSFYADNPRATQTEAARVVSRSRQWVSSKLAELETEGAVSRNGNGVEVLTL